MLRYRTVPHDLNVTMRDRASVALVWIMALTGAGMIVMPAASLPLMSALLAVCMAGLCVLNAHLYRFFARTRGVLFALRGLPLHWLYFWYCGLAIPMALGVHTWRVTTSHEPVVAQDA